MSVSIMPRQVVKNAAVAIAELSEKTNPSKDLIPAIKIANRFINDIEKVTGEIKGDLVDKAVAISEAFRAMNTISIHEQYNPEIAKEIIGDSPLFSRDDFDDIVGQLDNGKSPQFKLAFLVANLDEIDHGLIPSVSNYNMTANVQALQIEAMRSITNGIVIEDSYGLPSEEILADSIQKLSVNGDYLLKQDSGMRALWDRLDGAIGLQKNNLMGNDVFVKLYDQAHTPNVQSMQVPTSGDIKGRGFYELQNGVYKLAGDVPYPEQRDLYLLGKSIDFVEKSLMRLPLENNEGVPLSDFEKKRFVSDFSKFAEAAHAYVNRGPVMDAKKYTHLMPNDALDESVKYRVLMDRDYAVVMDGKIPTIPIDRKPNYSIPSMVRKIRGFSDASNGNLHIIPFSEVDSVKEQYPDVTVLPIKLTGEEEAALRSYSLEPKTTSEYCFSMAIKRAYEAHAGPDGKLSGPNHEVAESIVNNLTKQFPTMPESVFDIIRQEMDDVEHIHTNVMTAHNLFLALPMDVKKGLKDFENSYLTPKEEDPKNDEEIANVQDRPVLKR